MRLRSTRSRWRSCRRLSSLTVLVSEDSSITSSNAVEPAGCLRRRHVRKISTRGAAGPIGSGSTLTRPRGKGMIQPEFDPGAPWRDGLLAAVVILVVSTHLALWLTEALDLLHPIERLLG